MKISFSFIRICIQKDRKLYKLLLFLQNVYLLTLYLSCYKVDVVYTRIVYHRCM